jgi:hypothetical protein
MDHEEKRIWDALRNWLETDDEGKAMLSQLGTNAPEAGAALYNWLNKHNADSPETLVNLITGGQIDKLVNIARAGVVVISQPKVSGPLLSLPRLTLSERTRLNFAARRTELVGRESELQSLEGFLDSDRPFSWWLLTGPAGVGKSRLALDFCLQKAESWKTGFIPAASTFADWGEWQPAKPTLAVIDYAADRVNMLRPALRALSQRHAGEKIRFLLLERTQSDYWWKELIGYGTESYVLEDSNYGPSLPVSPMSKENIARIVEQIVDEEVLKTKDEAFLKELHNMKFLDRPLFAALAADAINSGRDPRQWDEERLVRDVLEREINLRWMPAGLKSGDLKVLVLSTMVSGLPASFISNNSFPDVLPAAENVDFKLYRTATGGTPNELIEPLEPDIVGEFFVLEQLGPESEFHQQAAGLIKAAWSASPEDIGSFISRADTDFPNHPSNSLLVLDLPSDPIQQYYWIFPARTALGRALARDNLNLSVNICRRILESRFEHPYEKRMREYYKDEGYESFFNIPDGHIVGMTGPDAYSLALHLSDLRRAIGFPLRSVIEKLYEDQEFQIAEDLTTAYLKFVESHPYDRQSVASYVWVAFENIHLAHSAGQKDESISWYRHVSEIAQLWPDHNEIWDARQKGLVNLISELIEANRSDEALPFFAELRQLWVERPQDQSVGARVREAARSLPSALYRSGRVQESLQVLEDTRSLMTAREDLAILTAIGEILANFSSLMMQSGDVQGANAMREQLRKLRVKGRKKKDSEKAAVERYLRTIQAVDTANQMTLLSQARSLEGFSKLYDELREIDEKGIASQPLSDFRERTLVHWMTTAYRCDSMEELELAYSKAREFAAQNAEYGPRVIAIGARLLAATLIGEGLNDRAVSVLSESAGPNAEQLWASANGILEDAEIAEIQALVESLL